MPGVIVFNANCLTNQGNSQKADKPFPADMTFAIDNLVAVLVAAGKADGRIGTAVGTEPQVFDVGTPFKDCSMTTGLLKMPAPLPANQPYHMVMAAKEVACKQTTGGYLEVREGMHISHSCSDPHLTVLIYGSDRKQIGQNIHICAEPDGTKWKFTRVH